MNTQVLTPVKPVRVVNFAKILPLFQPVSGASLIPLGNPTPSVHLVGRPELPPMTLAKRPDRDVAPARLQKQEMRKFSVTKTTGTENLQAAGVADLDLPFGMPRFVNAATLKEMFKADSSELLLKKVGARWEICEDSTPIDLTDDSLEFRLGTVQIFS